MISFSNSTAQDLGLHGVAFPLLTDYGGKRFDNSTMKKNLIKTTSNAIASFFVFCTYPSFASTIVSFTDSTGTDPTRSFSSGDFTLTFSPSSNSPQNYVTSSAKGVCLFANTTNDTANRCNVLDPVIGNGNLNYISLTANKSLILTGGKVDQINGSPLAIDLSYTFGGSSLGAINPSLGEFTFISPITLSQGQEIIFSGSGVDSALRISSLTVENVPGPLPLLGAAAAFGYTRSLRRKINNNC